MGHMRKELLVRSFDTIDQFIESRFDTWCQWRRHLHANPELSWQEAETTDFIGKQLTEIGLTLTAGPRQRGGFANIGQNDSLPLVAIRGDIDAIPVNELTDVPFRSQVPGVMHACGHDVHATVVLAVCDTLQHLLSNNCMANGLNVRAIFQPAEEVAEGATETIAAGALQGVHRIFTLHVDPTREVGCFGFRDGPQTACCDEILVKFHGPGGHGARPHETADPVFAAAQFINAAYGSVPRMTDPRRSTVLSFCQIAGGHSANVIPTDVQIKGTLRSFDSGVRDRVFKQLANLAVTIGDSLGVKIEFVPGVSIPSVDNCPETNGLLRSVAEVIVGKECISEVEPSLGGEDFACYQTQIPGSLVRVGSANGSRGTAHLHSPHFDVDERVIRHACRLFSRAILQLSGDAEG